MELKYQPKQNTESCEVPGKKSTPDKVDTSTKTLMQK